MQELLGRFNGGAPGAWDERDALLREMLRRVGEGVAGVVAAGVPARIRREIGDDDRVTVPLAP